MSKLSVHISSGNRHGFGDFLQKCTQAQQSPPVIYSVNENIADDLRRFSPTTKWIYRFQSAVFNRLPAHFFEDDPVASATNWLTVAKQNGRTLLDNWRLNPADWHDPLNEPVPGTPAQAQWLNTWMLTALNIAHDQGFRLALFSFATGSPDYGLWQFFIPALQLGRRFDAILSLHAYDDDGLITRQADGSLTENTLSRGLRYRRIRSALPPNARLPIVISEASSGNGYDTKLRDQPWVDDMGRYDVELQRDADLLAACAFQLGGNESNLQLALGIYGDYIAAHPNTLPDNPPTEVPPSNTETIETPPAISQRGKPRLEYARVVYLPDGGTEAQQRSVFDQMLRDQVGEYSLSYDSAMLGDLAQRTVHVFGPDVARQAAVADFRNKAYPGVTLIFKPWPSDKPIAAVVTEDFWVDAPIRDIPLFVTDQFNAPRDYANHKHEGVDFRAYDLARRQPVRVCAAQDGVVDEVDTIFAPGRNYGRHVIIRHNWQNDVYRTWYCHLSETAANLQPGQTIKRGDIVGVAGATGTTAIHLHFNVQHLGRGLAGYFVPDVIDPLTVLRQLKAATAQTIAAGAAWRGLHMRADGHSEPIDFECLRVGGLEAAKILTNTSFEELQQLITTSGLAPSKIVLRLFADFRGRVVPPLDFVEWQRAWLNEFQRVGGRYVEVHNEPNLPDEGLGTTWANAASFAGWFSTVAQRLRAEFPQLRIGYPGLSPSGGLVQPRGDVIEWLPTIRGLIARNLIDWIGAHCYWQSVAQMNDSNDGRFYERFLNFGRPVIITEFSNNSGTVPATEKGAQYKTYYSSLPANVLGAFSFVSSASDPVFNAHGETWAVNGQLTDIVRQVAR
jgi:murein DD-endopeptidase MepM/ murein hydrolase activator NlpD